MKNAVMIALGILVFYGVWRIVQKPVLKEGLSDERGCWYDPVSGTMKC